MDHFTPLASSLGGILLGIASSLLFLANGRICGISGIAGGLVGPASRSVHGERLWRLVFIAGLLTGGVLVVLFDRGALAAASEQSVPFALASGALVGIGTRMGNGCTSGHGLCGIALGSRRSITATAIFMATGAATVALVRHVLHAGGAS